MFTDIVLCDGSSAEYGYLFRYSSSEPDDDNASFTYLTLYFAFSALRGLVFGQAHFIKMSDLVTSKALHFF